MRAQLLLKNPFRPWRMPPAHSPGSPRRRRSSEREALGKPVYRLRWGFPFTYPAPHVAVWLLTCRVAVVGNVDAGKSTLLGVLTHGELDNGRGFARQKLFRHKHEIESGRTSSVGNDILGFDSEGNVVNKPDSHGGSLEWTKICEKSTKVITFIDLAGHEKYLKTTVFGMTGHLPDFCMLMVSAARQPPRRGGGLCARRG